MIRRRATKFVKKMRPYLLYLQLLWLTALCKPLAYSELVNPALFNRYTFF